LFEKFLAFEKGMTGGHWLEREKLVLIRKSSLFSTKTEVEMNFVAELPEAKCFAFFIQEAILCTVKHGYNELGYNTRLLKQINKLIGWFGSFL